MGGVHGFLRERVDDGDAPLERHRREPQVEPGSHRQAVGDLDGEGRIDPEAAQGRLLRDVAAAEPVGVGPLRLEPEGHVEADAEDHARAERLGVVHGGRKQHRRRAALGDAGSREGIGALELPRRHHPRTAQVDLLAAEERDAGRVVEDGRGVGRLGREGAGEAHPLAPVLEEREAGRPQRGGSRQESEREGYNQGAAPAGATGHGIKPSEIQDAGRNTRVSRPPPGRGAKRTNPPRSLTNLTASPNGPGSLPAAMRCWSSGPRAPS